MSNFNIDTGGTDSIYKPQPTDPASGTHGIAETDDTVITDLEATEAGVIDLAGRVTAEAWPASTAVKVRQLAYGTNGVLVQCTVAGTTGATQPTWPTTVGGTVVDGGATWKALAVPGSGSSVTGSGGVTVAGGNASLAQVPTWAASTAYTAGQIVLSPSGAYTSGVVSLVQAKSSFTSAASFTATNWTHLADIQSGAYVPLVTAISYAATITPALSGSGTNIFNVGQLTGNITINNPTGTPTDGQKMEFRFSSDATGGRTLTFGAAYAFGTDVTTSLIPNAPSSNWIMLFEYNQANTTWRAVSIIRGF